VANGTSVQCLCHLAQAQWEVQGIQFISNCKVLPLQHYDMILGFDWLEQFSSLKIHWVDKWISIPYGASTVVIQGILSELQAGIV
jgi:hypothetical protein